jgi:hypothetical protein
MTRAEVAAIIAVELATQLSDASMTGADTTGNLKEPIDQALRAMGESESTLSTATSDDPLGFLAMVRYQTLVKVRFALATNFDISMTGMSVRLQQQFANITVLLEAARAEVIAIFGSVNPGSSADSSVAFIDLAYLELTDDAYADAYAGAAP